MKSLDRNQFTLARHNAVLACLGLPTSDCMEGHSAPLKQNRISALSWIQVTNSHELCFADARSHSAPEKLFNVTDAPASARLLPSLWASPRRFQWEQRSASNGKGGTWRWRMQAERFGLHHPKLSLKRRSQLCSLATVRGNSYSR